MGRQERRMRGYQVDESWKLDPSQKSGIKKKAIKASASVVPQFFIVRNMYLRLDFFHRAPSSTPLTSPTKDRSVRKGTRSVSSVS